MWLVRLFNCCFETGGVPWEWCRACIVRLHKGKGHRCECSNSRDISLLASVRRLYRRVLIDSIRCQTDGVLPEEQFGFRSSKGMCRSVFWGKAVL